MQQQIVAWNGDNALASIQAGLQYGQAKQNSSGKGKSVNFVFAPTPATGAEAATVPMVLQTPRMHVPFGVNIYTPDGTCMRGV